MSYERQSRQNSKLYYNARPSKPAANIPKSPAPAALYATPAAPDDDEEAALEVALGPDGVAVAEPPPLPPAMDVIVLCPAVELPEAETVLCKVDVAFVLFVDPAEAVLALEELLVELLAATVMPRAEHIFAGIAENAMVMLISQGTLRNWGRTMRTLNILVRSLELQVAFFERHAGISWDSCSP